MGSVTDFLSKARYPVIFLAVGVVLALAASATTFKFLGVEFSPYGLPGRIGLGVLALGLILLGAVQASRRPAAAGPRPETQYDVFLAAPMAGTADEAEYQAIRSLCMDVLTILRAHCGVKTWYFVGERLATKDDFESYGVAAETDFDALAVSRSFILIYPSHAVSSVLAETGFALARNIPTTLYAARGEDLPYLLRAAGQLPQDRYPPVKMVEYGTPDNLKRLIHNDGVHLFTAARPADAEA